MGLIIRAEPVPGNVCRAAKYLLELIQGSRKEKEFDLNKLIVVFEYAGAEYSMPGGSQVRFDVSVKDVFPSIHKIHGTPKKINKAKIWTIKNRGKSPFLHNLRRCGYDLENLLIQVLQYCKEFGRR